MIRPFDWRDVVLVRRLANQGVCLDAETCFARGWHSLQSALLAYLAPGVGTPTFVWQDEARGGAAAFGQIHHRTNDDLARLLFVAPAYSAAAQAAWEDLVEHAVEAAGERGAHNLIAHVDQGHGEFEVLRRLGFAVYARQSIWRLPAGRRPGPNGDAPVLRQQQSQDGWGIHMLYNNVVPRLIQQVEPPPKSPGRGYVLEEDGEISAYLNVARGPLGVWCEPFLHPQAYNRSAEVIASFLSLVAESADRPVLFCVKSYQEWLHEPLAAAGFAPAGDQAVMVKRLAVRLAESEPSLAALLESSRGEVPSPLVKSTQHK